MASLGVGHSPAYFLDGVLDIQAVRGQIIGPRGEGAELSHQVQSFSGPGQLLGG